MKKKLIPVLAAAAGILLVFAGALGMEFLQKYMPSKEPSDLGRLLGVEGEATAVFLNNERQKEDGITRDGQTYLSLEWVNQYLNERFYWDDVEKLLVYTLPDTIVYADKRTQGQGGQPLLLEEEGQIYLAAGLVGSYTDIQTEAYNTDEHKRIYIDNTWAPKQMGTARSDTAVREKGGIKSPVITTVQKGDSFQILEQMTDWAKVRTEDGYIGYLQNRRIGSVETVQDVSLFIEPVYTSISLEEGVCLGWHQVLSEADNQNLEALAAHAEGMNVIAPTWLMLTDNEGNYHSWASRGYVDQAHAMGLQVWAVLDNFNMGDEVNSEILFARTSVRKKLIESLMADAETYDLDGINLDIEGIRPEAGPHYVQFIRELSVACRNQGVILSVDNYVPSSSTEFYNRAEQGRVADYVIVMAYDEHHAGGEAGSVSSLPFVERGIAETAKDVPAEKLVAAVPFYTRVWTEKDGETTSSALGIEGAKNWIEEHQVELTWQEETGQYYGELQTEEGLKRVWMEEETSLGLKMDLIRQNELAGVACWKLGFEPASVWDVIGGNE